MLQQSRRDFLADVGRGMLVAGVGASAAFDLGLTPVRAADEPAELSFGPREPLVRLLQETPVEKLLPVLVERIQSGTTLQDLIAAAALANARSFGGEDYIGFHTLMAIPPALAMAGEMPAGEQALPVLKVLYRNTNRIQEHGGRAEEVLHPVKPAELSAGAARGELLQAAVRRRDLAAAEGTFAACAQGTVDEAFNDLLMTVHDHTEVHRVVLPYRAWELVGIVGKEHAHTLLRQSVRYCTQNEKSNNGVVRALLEKLFDQHHLAGKQTGTKAADDAWVDKLCNTVFTSSPEQAADAVAAALAEGMAPDAVAEAISLAANQIVLRDGGRPAKYANEQKPPGSVHGDSLGVHASDTVNAYRNMARAVNARNAMAGLILAAYNVGSSRAASSWETDFLTAKPYPREEELQKVRSTSPQKLLAETEEAVRGKEQARACAVVHRYGELGFEARPMFDVLLRYAVSEDGALHAEKYYRTVSDEFAHMRPAFRWREVVALARVTASEFGRAAPGYGEARSLLKLS